MARTVEVRAWNPLRNFQFHVIVDDVEVAGVSAVSGLSVAIAPFELWEGGNNLHRYAQPDKVTWEPVTLEHGLAIDDTLERWARAVTEYSTTGARPDEPLKRNVVIDVWDFHSHLSKPDRGRRVRRYTVKNAWISRYQALPRLDAMGSAVAIASVEVTHEGWVMEPHDPSQGVGAFV